MLGLIMCHPQANKNVDILQKQGHCFYNKDSCVACLNYCITESSNKYNLLQRLK